MDRKTFYSLRDAFIVDVFNKCLDKREYRALKRYLEKSDTNNGGFGGIVPVEKDDFIAILNEENVEYPEGWIESMIDFGFFHKTYSTYRSTPRLETIECIGVNPQARHVLNLKYFNDYVEL